MSFEHLKSFLQYNFKRIQTIKIVADVLTLHNNIIIIINNGRFTCSNWGNTKFKATKLKENKYLFLSCNVRKKKVPSVHDK